MKQPCQPYCQTISCKLYLMPICLASPTNAFPIKPITSKGESALGRGKSKVRKTEMATGSATGKKFLMFIIGKLKNRRCFKNVKKLPCQYVSQKKSKMNSQILEGWVLKFNRKFRVNERENCSYHS